MRSTFRIGTTSYIYPAEIIANVLKLKDRVDDIELLLFEVNDEREFPSKKEVKKLRQLGADYDLTYTIHLPLDLLLGSVVDRERKASMDMVVSLMNYLQILSPHSYILHLNFFEDQGEDIEVWKDKVRGSCEYIIKKIDFGSERISIENLNYPFTYVEDVISANNLSVCIDVGHLLVRKIDIEKHICKYIKRTRVIHLHGVRRDKDRERDHVSLKYIDKELLARVLKLVRDSCFQGVLTLEVFSKENFEDSMSVLYNCIGIRE